MGTILTFPSDREKRGGTVSEAGARPASAEILMFTGVRIERHEAGYEPPGHGEGGRGGRARKTS